MTTNDSTTHADAVAALSSLPKDQQATVWKYLMECGAEGPSLTGQEREGLLNEISCTAINVDELLLDYLHRTEISPEARWATMESARTLIKRIGLIADHLHSPGEGEVKGDAYTWMDVPRGKQS